MVKTCAWLRSPDLVPPEAQGLHTASHTVRLREAGLCALLHTHGRPQDVETGYKAVLHSEGTVWF